MLPKKDDPDIGDPEQPTLREQSTSFINSCEEVQSEGECNEVTTDQPVGCMNFTEAPQVALELIEPDSEAQNFFLKNDEIQTPDELERGKSLNQLAAHTEFQAEKVCEQFMKDPVQQLDSDENDHDRNEGIHDGKDKDDDRDNMAKIEQQQTNIDESNGEVACILLTTNSFYLKCGYPMEKLYPAMTSLLK